METQKTFTHFTCGETSSNCAEANTIWQNHVPYFACLSSLLHESCFVLISYPSETCHIWSSALYLTQAMWTHNTFPNHLRTFFVGALGLTVYCVLLHVSCLVHIISSFPLCLSLRCRRWHGGKISAYSRIQIRIGIAVRPFTVDIFDVASCYQRCFETVLIVHLTAFWCGICRVLTFSGRHCRGEPVRDSSKMINGKSGKRRVIVSWLKWSDFDFYSLECSLLFCWWVIYSSTMFALMLKLSRTVESQFLDCYELRTAIISSKVDSFRLKSSSSICAISSQVQDEKSWKFNVARRLHCYQGEGVKKTSYKLLLHLPCSININNSWHVCLRKKLAIKTSVNLIILMLPFQKLEMKMLLARTLNKFEHDAWKWNNWRRVRWTL